MCSKPIINTLTKPFAQAGSAVGSAFERNISKPIKTASDNLGSWFESKISSNVENAADDTANFFESNISKPSKAFWDNRKNWFDKPGMPDVPGAEDAAGQGPMSTFIGGTDVASARRRRRLLAMRQGLLSTIGTSAAGITGAPILSTPTSSIPKLKLGQ
jgi:hypothetical protein